MTFAACLPAGLGAAVPRSPGTPGPFTRSAYNGPVTRSMRCSMRRYVRPLVPLTLAVLLVGTALPASWSQPANAATPATDPTGRAETTAIEDTYVAPGNPALAPDGLPLLMVGDEGLDGREAFLRFPLPAVPAGARNLSVSLVLSQIGAPRAGAVKAYSMSDSWTAPTVTSQQRPTHDAFLGRELAQPPGAATWVALPASALLGSSTSSIDFAITATIGDASALAFASADNPDPGLRPRLVVDYTLPTGSCSVSTLLVPGCGAWFGSTANPTGGEQTATDAVAREETQLGRGLGIVHVYHVGAQSWPTPTEVALATDPAKPRILMVNWKPEQGMTWAEVAAGASDALIDDTAVRITQRLGDVPFFLTLHHEPENELQGAGSGFTPADYVAMLRHVVQRLRGAGVSHAVMVWDVMGFAGWGDQGLYPQLYPGDDVVDWIGYDPYSHGGRALDQFANAGGTAFPGFYTWATTAHPGKPLMLAEFGVESTSVAERVSVFSSLAATAPTMPALKAFVYFNHGPDSVTGTNDYALDSDPQVLAAARAAFADLYFQP